ncbi:16S rRNA (adenine(1518)-N(6)/adenine(1519)-N(6))-dimethyltransferase [Notoacmeibacter marinus]|uniref:Ribosomal RNA small subunit methyltransferase A n=2 Tax=Notoacmeibacter marinus TaxID=1876515 RepID=A0A231UTS5_9HYPH|nr:16S rRNA (adenine(1518)-N(6)/adenine(1519)-N(6))-dimethyltransferase [Notoacmeibacter marinus]
MSPDGLPPLRQVVERHGIAAKKSLGQNFLFDLNLTAKIARSAGALKDHTVVEIGPGPGGLTRALLAADAAEVIAIERDSRCIAALEEIGKAYPDRLTIVPGDALALDYVNLTKTSDRPVKIVANLPYNIGTELLLGWLTSEDWPPFWSSLTLMFQKEVAQRIVAQPGDKHYGRLGVLTGWRCQAVSVFDVPKEAFSPPPKVTSSIVHVEPRSEPLSASLDALERVTSHAFGQRRKMLRQSLKPLGGEALLERVGIDPTRRAETLSIEEFVALANAIPAGQSS